MESKEQANLPVGNETMLIQAAQYEHKTYQQLQQCEDAQAALEQSLANSEEEESAWRLHCDALDMLRQLNKHHT